MASSSYSASKYNSKKSTPTKQTDDQNWEFNQMRMNQSLNEFLRTSGEATRNANNNNNNNTSETNLDITNLDEEEAVKEKGISSSGGGVLLDSNSTTAEFKNYLDELKKNYLEKLTFSCPSKLNKASQDKTTNLNAKLKSVENISNLIAKHANMSQETTGLLNARRSLFTETKAENLQSLDEEKPMLMQRNLPGELSSLQTNKTDLFDTPELTKSQILSRLVQIREYLKQSYSMLSTLKSSNDLANYANQMNKLHSLIDHLKDQEKGYTDLLHSFSKFQQISVNMFPIESGPAVSNVSLAPSSNQYQKDILDLSELNESVQQQQNQQQQQHNEFLKQHANYLNTILKNSSSNLSALGQNIPAKSVAVQTLPLNVSLLKSQQINKNSDECGTLGGNEESGTNSIAGSFISDTLTLNGINCDVNNLLKYKPNVNSEMNRSVNMNGTSPSGSGGEANENDLIVIGKAFYPRSEQNENYEDENKTENDLDLLEDDTNDYNYSSFRGETLNEYFSDEKGNVEDPESIREQRKEILSALDNDLTTLEQLKEQKKLLKSIRLRKEELKALEGRRKALEALKKIAVDTETLGSAFEPVKTNKSNETEEKKSVLNNLVSENELNQAQKYKEVTELYKYFDELKQKQTEREKAESHEQSTCVEEFNESFTKQKQLIRKTYKHSTNQDNHNEMSFSYIPKSDGFIETSLVCQSKIEPSSQIEKSKQTVQHYEELIRKKKSPNNNVYSSMIEPLSDCKNNQDLFKKFDHTNDSSLKEDLTSKLNIDDELSQKMSALAKNEKKLEELYAMQAKLAQLKSIMGNFGDSKSKNPNEEYKNEAKICDEDQDEDEKEEENQDLTKVNTNSLKNENQRSLLEIESLESRLKNVMIRKKLLENEIDKKQENARFYEEKELINKNQSDSSSNNSDNEEDDNPAYNELDNPDYNNDQVEEQKIKLANAKEKLKQLQELIVKLKSASSLTNNSSGQITAVEQHKLEQKEARAALDLLNEIEKQKKQDRLDELKRNKQKLLMLLKEKENETAELDRIYTATTKSYSNRSIPKNSEAVTNQLISKTEDSVEEEIRLAKSLSLNSPFKTSNEFPYSNEIENKFQTAENDFDILNGTAGNTASSVYPNPRSTTDYMHSPSDLLWTQMKKQLTMRENLRNKKKELEDLIRVENNTALLPKRRDQEEKEDDLEEQVEQEMEEEEKQSNKIINGYQDFFLKQKPNITNVDMECKKEDRYSFLINENLKQKEEEEEIEEAEDEEEIIMKRYVPSTSSNTAKQQAKKHFPCQQENVCPTDELIVDENHMFSQKSPSLRNNESESDDYQEESDSNESNEKNRKNFFTKYNECKEDLDKEEHLQLLNDLRKQFTEFTADQTKFNHSMKKTCALLLNSRKQTPRAANVSPMTDPYLMVSQFQFQTQMQVQQLMFNLNAAYHEIATQRAEMAKFSEQMKVIHERFDKQEAASAKKATQITPVQTCDISTPANSNFTNKKKEKLSRFTNVSTSTGDSKVTIGTNTALTCTEDNTNVKKSSRLTSNALPSYFYNRNRSKEDKDIISSSEHTQVTRLNRTTKQNEPEPPSSKMFNYEKIFSKLEQQEPFCSKMFQNNNKHDHYYTDDFDDDEEEENKKKKERSASIASSTQTNMSKSTTTMTAISSSSSKTSSSSSVNSSEQAAFWKANESKKPSLTSCGELIQFDRMREKIYAEVGALISQNETRPVFLVNLFKELQCLKDKRSRDQLLKSISEINKRQVEQEEDDVTRKFLSKDTSRTQSPVESDSLSNTVIFVKNSPHILTSGTASDSMKKDEILFSRSSSSSIMGVLDVHLKRAQKDENLTSLLERGKIENEVRELISKLIKVIKLPGDGEFDDDNENDSKYEKLCDTEYLIELSDKVLDAVRDKESEYVRVYENQLKNGLREVLSKYRNKLLVRCMEDILIDISHVLYNELTYYSLFKRREEVAMLNKSSGSDNTNLNLIKSLARNTNNNNNNNTFHLNKNPLNIQSDSSRSRSMSSERSSSTQNDEVYYFDENSIKTKLDYLKKEKSDLSSKLEENYSDILSRLKCILNEKTDTLNTLLDEHQKIMLDETDEEERDRKQEEDIFEVKELKFSSNKEINETDEIVIDDLPDKLNVDGVEQTIDFIDKVIIESIEDDLVGDENALPCVNHQEQTVSPSSASSSNNLDDGIERNIKSSEDEVECLDEKEILKSNSSNSDHFVIISNENSDQEILSGSDGLTKEEENNVKLVEEEEKTNTTIIENFNTAKTESDTETIQQTSLNN